MMYESHTRPGEFAVVDEKKTEEKDLCLVCCLRHDQMKAHYSKSRCQAQGRSQHAYYNVMLTGTALLYGAAA